MANLYVTLNKIISETSLRNFSQAAQGFLIQIPEHDIQSFFIKLEKIAMLFKRRVSFILWSFSSQLISTKLIMTFLQTIRMHPLLTLFRMGFFGAAHRLGGQKGPPSLKSVTHSLQWWNLAQLYLIQRRSKKYMNHLTYTLSSADIFSPEISKFCYIKKYRYRLYFDT